MKPRNRLILAAVTLLILLIAVPSLAQGPLKIKVKGTEIVTGVVIVDIVQNGKPFELQCNAGSLSLHAAQRRQLHHGRAPREFRDVPVPERRNLYRHLRQPGDRRRAGRVLPDREVTPRRRTSKMKARCPRFAPRGSALTRAQEDFENPPMPIMRS